ncbi:MAG: hypothetical protein KF685_03100 [Acidobacteria bacterium]|nr:hypothetical protein [Acidobacteriota bacterium]
MSTVFAVLVLFHMTPAQTKADEADKQTAKIRNKIVKIGVGSEKQVSITLKSKTRIRGYITIVAADDFTVMNLADGQPTLIAFTDVKSVNRGGRELSTGKKILAGAALAWLSFVIISCATGHCQN